MTERIGAEERYCKGTFSDREMGVSMLFHFRDLRPGDYGHAGFAAFKPFPRVFPCRGLCSLSPQSKETGLPAPFCC